MFQRTLRWNAVGVVFALALVFGLLSPPRAQAQAPLRAQQVASLLQSWWSGLWTAKIAAPDSNSSVDPVRVDWERSATADPNGLKSATPGPKGSAQAPRSSSGRPRG